MPRAKSVSAGADDAARRRSIAFLNWAHALDHFVLLIFPTVVIGLEVIYQRPYSELIALSSTAFLAFGIFSLPAGWLADRWSRRNMMAAFFLGCGVSLAAAGLAPNLTMLAVAMFALGIFAAIYHPVGMAMLIEASGAKGRTLAFNGVCGNLGVSLAAGISGALAYWVSWRAAFFAPAVVLVVSGIFYIWMTPDDSHHAKSRVSKPAVPLTAKLAFMLFGLFIVIALSAGLAFNVLTIALPKIVDERLSADLPLVMVGSIATAVLVCGALAQLIVGRVVEWLAPHTSTNVAMLPIATSDTSLVMPSSTIFGSAMVSTLNTSPAVNAMNRNRPNSMAKDVSLVAIGSIATLVLVCGAIAQLAVGRLVERISAPNLFVAVTAFGFAGNLWATYATGIPLLVALAVAVAAIYGQVTVNDIILARYTADAWRGRVYAVRYFTLFISAGIAIAMISLLHKSGGFAMVLGANSVVALAMFLAALGLVTLIYGIEARHAAAQPAE